MKKKFILLPTIVACTAFSPLISCGQSKFNIAKMKSNYLDIIVGITPTVAEYYDDKTVVDFEEASADDIKAKLESVTRKGLLDKEYETYKFTDIHYDDPDRSAWPAHQHVERALKIAVAAYKTNDAEKMDIAIKLAYWWLADDLWNTNWWFNTIGVPRDIGSLGIIIFDKLTPGGQSRLLEFLHRGSYKYAPSTQTYTGANLFWYGDITLKCAILENDQDALKLMIDCVSKGIVEDDYEGFQSDGTFFQHGRLVYNGGYGRQAATLLTQIFATFAGSGYEWSEEKLNILVNYILNGVATNTHKGTFSYLTLGRTHCRKNATNVDGVWTDLGNVAIFKFLTNLENCPRKDEINNMIDALEKKDRGNFEGIKCFPTSSMVSMNVGDDVFMSFKGISNTLRGSEQANSENILGHNFSFGVNTCVMETGNEYKDIAPYWEYDKIPGTTTLAEDDAQLSKYEQADYEEVDGSGPFYCGELNASDPNNHVAFVMQKTYHAFRQKDSHLKNIKLNYTVTCFATPNGMVILGSGLSLEGSTDPFRTNVEHCLTTGSVALTPDNKTVTHGNVVYKNLTTDSIFTMTNADSQFHDWGRNKDTYKGQGEVPAKRMLTIQLEQNAPQYAYSIQPKSKADAFNFIVACNNENIHAIDIGNGKIAVACYEPGTFTYDTHPYTISQKGYSIIEKKA